MKVAGVISPTLSIWWKIGAIAGASGVMLGAFGAHGLKNRVKDPQMLKNWETAAQYQLIHSLVLLATPMCRRPALVGGTCISGHDAVFRVSLCNDTDGREKTRHAYAYWGALRSWLDGLH
ncbi:unnamed protein product [Peronospora belbahrii]|uniref:HIG1 domain-containing protein n=1 Tax=Peronospora belbahrii TaxID=622444 RepID=A0AAU9L952_9STRA|nr:unnamed protein product [Peronospora belbahrii]